MSGWLHLFPSRMKLQNHSPLWMSVTPTADDLSPLHSALLFCTSESYGNWSLLRFQYSTLCALCLWQQGGSPAASFANTVPTSGTLESASSYKTVPSLLCDSSWWPISKWSTRCWCSLLPRISWWWCYSSTAWWCWPWMSMPPCGVSENAWKESTDAQVYQLRVGSHLGPGQVVRRRAWLFLYRPCRSPLTTLPWPHS